MRFSKIVLTVLLASQSTPFAQTPSGSGLDPARLQTIRPQLQALVDRQLMAHTSGLGGDPEGELADNPRSLRVPLSEAVRYYAHSHLEFEPGTRWSYSNMGIAALGRLIEVISGDDYVHFVRTRILEPLD